MQYDDILHQPCAAWIGSRRPDKMNAAHGARQALEALHQMRRQRHLRRWEN